MNNYSKQREIILEVIKRNRIHPTAEQIYKLVTKQEPKISKSTIYRNIGILLETGVIQKIKIDSGADRYDYIDTPHYHAICRKCGEVYDFEYDFNKKEIENAIIKKSKIEFQVENITIQGICVNCKSNQKKKEE